MGAGLDEALELFRQWLAAQGASRRTMRERLIVVAAFGEFVGVDPRLATQREVIAYLSRPDIAPWTRTTYWGHLRSWFAWLTSVGQTSPLEGMRAPKTPRGRPRPLNPGEVELLLLDAPQRMADWMALGLYAGLRASEIARIESSHVTEATMWIMGKGGVSDYLPTAPAVWEIASRRGPGLWFPSRLGGGPLRPETVSHKSALFFHAHGVEGSIHRCRHTFATNLLRSGADIRTVQRLMRHANLNTTASYTAVDEDKLRAAVLRIRGAA